MTNLYKQDIEVENPLGHKSIFTSSNVSLFITKIKSYETYRRAGSNPRIYLWAKNYNPIQDIQGERWNKPYELIRPHLVELLKTVGVDAEGVRFSWDQRAGCQCGCSPGFIARNLFSDKDFSIEYEANLETKTSALAKRSKRVFF